jgi:4-amino-4-deoxy-L-arabinose transferase-like glycosyltransferase
MEITRDPAQGDLTADADADAPQPVTRRRFPLAIWLIVALQTMLMLGMTVLYPPFQSPDEVAHIDYVLAHRHGEFFDRIGERLYQSGVLKASSEVQATQFVTHVGGGTVVPRAQRKSFDALGTGTNSPFPNQMVQHPPLYYGLAAGFSFLLPNFSHHRFDIQIFWLRLFSVLLLLPVPLLIYAAAMRATERPSLALVAAILPLSVPSYLRTGGSVTNDSLLTLLTVVCGALLVRVAWGDLSRRTAVLLGLAWGAALLTKGFALALPPAIVLAYLVGADGSLRDRIRASWRGIALSGVIGFALGGWWWIRNLAIYGRVQPDGFATLSPALRQKSFGADRPGGGDTDFFTNFFALLGRRLWGSLGLIDRPSLSPIVLMVLAWAFFAGLVVAVVAGVPRFSARVRVPRWTVGRAVSLVLPGLLTLAVMYSASRSVYLRGRQLPAIQVRYLVPAILGTMICFALALHLAAGRLRRWLPPATLLASLVFMAFSVYRVLDIEMSSRSPDAVKRLRDALRFVIGWGPFPAAVTVTALAFAGVLAGATFVVLLVGAWRDESDRSHHLNAQSAAGSG